MGVIGWSELGLSYFISNLFVLLFVPHLLSFVAWIHLLVLPYSIWSVWYQKFRAKSWCLLCLMVQLVFWLLLGGYIWNGFYQVPLFSLENILSIGLVYGIPILGVNWFVSLYVNPRKLTDITQQINSLRVDNGVFIGLLKKMPYYKVDQEVSHILLGNPYAKNMITILSNPHCGPCANMHKRIERLLHETGNRYCVQYILSSFSEELNRSCEFFCYVNKTYSVQERDKIYNDWFEKGKYTPEQLFERYGFAVPDGISEEYQKHLDWRLTNKLQATPTVLFNGYTLPDIYFHQIGDLSYFVDIDMD